MGILIIFFVGTSGLVVHTHAHGEVRVPRTGHRQSTHQHRSSKGKSLPSNSSWVPPYLILLDVGFLGRRDSCPVYDNRLKRKFLGCRYFALVVDTPLQAVIYQKMGFQLLDKRVMPGPWGEWPLYILSMNTTADRQSLHEAR